MKCSFFFILLIVSGFISSGQTGPLRFVHISDTHIGSPNGGAEEDLRRTVKDINSRSDIAFVVITGDITELGADEELQSAKKILDEFKLPWYIIPGNHDAGWSESGGESFIKTFGNDKFVFDQAGIRFIGCASGPYVRMSDGHVPRSALLWMDSILVKTSLTQPLIFLNHYPLDPGLDNWYEITDRLNRHHTLAVLCGHGHANRLMNFDSIPAVMGRSNLRAKADTGGYNIVDIRNDSIIYTEHRPGTGYFKTWASIDIKKGNAISVSKKPDFSMNDKYPDIQPKWIFSSDANVISTPLVANDLVIFGNQRGKIEALSLRSGKKVWATNTTGAIFSSPETSKDNFIIGSADGSVYCFSIKTGKPVWTFHADAAVLGSPLVAENKVYIGASDHRFRALDANTGMEIWSFNELTGPVVSKPVLYKDKIIFGAWDRYLYALDKNSGKLIWKWNNGSAIRNYSPAACVPVVSGNEVYIVAPDRYITAIDIETGQTLWRNNDATVRESIGISLDGKWIYGKTMQDTIVAYAASRDKQNAAWKMNCGFGYEHVPSMLIEKDGLLFFGTRSGVVYCIDPRKQTIVWAYKIDNSMVNTVRVIDRKNIIAATMDGKVAFLHAE
jgi:outer membrane protein assembly factor BamB